MAVQSASELLAGGPEDDRGSVDNDGAGLGTVSVAPSDLLEADMALGKVATGLVCLTGGRRMGWNLSAGSRGFLDSTEPVWP